MRTTSTGDCTPSTALALADGYRADGAGPADDEILAQVARREGGPDLTIDYWNTDRDLVAAIRRYLQSHLSITPGDYSAFNRTLGIDTELWTQSERWQILTPARADFFGTDDLNRLIQFEFRGGLLKMWWGKGWPRPFGDQEITWTDKVMQTRNKRANASPPGLNYIANGEIGIVTNTSKSQRGSANDSLKVAFSTQPSNTYYYIRSEAAEDLELAYALTVHKAQGSDFDVVFLIVPEKSAQLSRELLYTGLTRFRQHLVLLIQHDIGVMRRLRRPEASATALRSTYMFTMALRPPGITRPRLDQHINRTKRGELVISKDEVIVANTLADLGVSYEYEQPLYARNSTTDFRLPDFTVHFQGDTWYWEYLGMLDKPHYRRNWERKRAWYQANGYEDQLITSQANSDGGIDSAEIERIALQRILGESIE